MLAESLRAEVNALATTLTHLPGEGIAVGAFEGDAILPQRRLGGADVVALLVSERWHEASHRAAGAGLRIIGEPPHLAVEGGDASALGHLPFLAVIGRVGLAGDDKHLADTDVRDAPPAAFPSGMHHPDIEPPPAARGPRCRGH